MPSKYTQNVSLTPELQQLISQKIASGHYRTASEVVRAALRLFLESCPNGNSSFNPAPTETWSPQQLTALFEQSTVGLAVVDLTGRFTWLNNRYCTIVARSREELFQLRMQDITHPEDLTSNLALFGEAASNDRSFEIQKRYIRPDGSLVWVNNSVSPVRNAEGTPGNILAVCVDITARKEAEAALRGSEEQHRALIEQTAVGVVHADLSGRLLLVNQAVCDILGYRKDELLRQSFQSITHPGDLEGNLALIRQLDAGEISSFTREEYYIRRDGSCVWVELTVSMVRDLAGAPACRVAVIKDVHDRKMAEEALRESEERFRSVYEQAAVGLERVALQNGRFLDVNPALCQMLGYTNEQLLSTTYLDITHPDDQAAELEQLGRFAAGEGPSFTVEKRYLHACGTYLWVLVTSSLIREKTGRPCRISVVQNISARKQAEVTLRGSETLKQAILDAALDCVITVTAESRIVEWNPASERTFGYSRDAVLDRDLAQLIIPPVWRERHYKGMARYLKTGHGPVLNQRIELEALRRDGSCFPVELAISPIEIDGQPHFTAYLRDISQRKAIEAALRESEQRLTSTYEHAFVGIAEMDMEGRYLRVNEQFIAITGYSREELLELCLVDITHPDDVGLDLERFRHQVAGELDAYTLEKRYIRKDGHVVWIEVASSRVDDDKKRPLYAIRVVRDISERRRWEQHQQLLINELNHRVKNTLATVQSMASQTLRNAATTAEAKEAFEARLMALSRAHDVLTRENWEAADLSDIILHAIAPYRSYGEARFRCQGPDIRLSPRMVLALAMALHELGTNAVKYGALSNATGHVDLTWQIQEADGGSYLRLQWAEAGGPPVEAPKKRGFGSRLIERSLAQDLGDDVVLRFEPGGLICTVNAPLKPANDEEVWAA